IEDVPFDELMERAFVGKREKIVRALFNRERYAELVDKGLVLPSAEARRLRQALAAARERLGAVASSTPEGEVLAERVAALERRLEAPVFDLSGLADVHLTLHRPAGDNVRWGVNVDVRVAHANLVPEHFPLPILAEDVRVLVDRQSASVRGGTYRTLRGGSGAIEADVRLEDEHGEELPFRPEVRI